jgi:hypothetical protein
MDTMASGVPVRELFDSAERLLPALFSGALYADFEEHGDVNVIPLGVRVKR